MIRSLQSLLGYNIVTTDGEVSQVSNAYLDVLQWTIRYLVAEVGVASPTRRILISPISVREIDATGRKIHLWLTNKQVWHSPAIDLAGPNVRAQEREYYRYYGWPFYWAGSGLWGGAMYPGTMGGVPPVTLDETADPPALTENLHDADLEAPEAESHLRSTNDVIGYTIQARDGQAGHVEDFLFEDQTWGIQYMVIHPSGEPTQRRVIIAPTWVQQVDWEHKQVQLDLTRETVQHSPEFEWQELKS